MDEDLGRNCTGQEMFIGAAFRRQDYAAELFGLSRRWPHEVPQTSNWETAIVSRQWCSDLAGYIAALENEVRKLSEKV